MGFFGEPTQKPNAHAYLKLVQASAWAAKHEKQRTAKTQHRLFERCFFITFFMHSINIYRVRTIIIYFFIRYPSRHLQVVWQGEDMFPTLFFCVAVMEWNAGTKRVYIGPFHDSLRYPPYPPSPCLLSFLHRADWVFDEWKSTERIYTMASFYYYDQNPSGFCFLVQIRAFVVEASLDYQI